MRVYCEDEYEDMDEYQDTEDQEEEEADDQDYEEEEACQRRQQELEYLELRQRLKEAIRKKREKEYGASSRENKNVSPKDNFGSFFGPSQPVIAQRVIRESKSLLKNPDLAARIVRSNDADNHKSSGSSIVGSKLGHNNGRSKLTSGLKTKVQLLRSSRDDLFLSDGSELPATMKDHPRKLAARTSVLTSKQEQSRNNPLSRNGKNKLCIVHVERKGLNGIAPRTACSGDNAREVPIGQDSRKVPRGHNTKEVPNTCNARKVPNNRDVRKVSNRHDAREVPKRHCTRKVPNSHDARRVPDSKAATKVPISRDARKVPQSQDARRYPNGHDKIKVLNSHDAWKCNNCHGIRNVNNSPDVRKFSTGGHQTQLKARNLKIPLDNMAVRQSIDSRKLVGGCSGGQPGWTLEKKEISSKASVDTTEKVSGSVGKSSLSSVHKPSIAKSQPSVSKKSVALKMESQQYSKMKQVRHRNLTRPTLGDQHMKRKTVRHDEEDDDPEEAISLIQKMFRYNPNKFEDCDDVDDMEANFDDIMKEERRSAKLARKEDKEELRKIEEEERRERMRKAKKRRLSQH